MPDPTLKDLTGQRFGRLVVAEIDLSRPGRGARWRCFCDCGGEKVVRGDRLRKGKTVSCGCRQAEGLEAGRYTHGLSNHPLYVVWQGILSRCYDMGHRNFAWYGARGIKVCGEWQDFAKFHAAVEPGWRSGLKLDRIDNDGDYAPGNVRWVTQAEQMRNTSRNVYLDTPDGVMMRCDAVARYGARQADKLTRVPKPCASI